MFKSRSVLASLLAMCGALCLVTAGASVATAAAPPTERQSVLLAIQHSNEGYLTTTDRKFLLKNPKFAASVVDPSQNVVSEKVEPAPVISVANRSAGQICRVTNRYQSASSLLRNKLYEYHTKVTWCYSTSTKKIVSYSQYAFFEKVDGLAFKVVNNDSLKRVNKGSSATWQTHNQGVLQNCVFKVGCVGYKYPQNKVRVSLSVVTFDYNQDDNKGWRRA